MDLSEFIKIKPLFYPFFISLLLLFVAVAFTFLNLYGTGNLLVMHYDGYKGIDFLGDKNDVFSILAIAIIFIVLNMWLAKRVYFRERFLAYLLSISSLILSLLILIGVFVIISIN